MRTELKSDLREVDWASQRENQEVGRGKESGAPAQSESEKLQ